MQKNCLARSVRTVSSPQVLTHVRHSDHQHKAGRHRYPRNLDQRPLPEECGIPLEPYDSRFEKPLDACSGFGFPCVVGYLTWRPLFKWRYPSYNPTYIIAELLSPLGLKAPEALTQNARLDHQHLHRAWDAQVLTMPALQAPYPEGPKILQSWN